MLTYLLDVGRLFLGLILLLAGGAKLLRPHPLAAGLAKVHGVDPALQGPSVHVARALAGVEVLASFLIVTRWWVSAGLMLAAAVGFGVAVFAASAVALDRRAPCGCFGAAAGKPVGLTNVLTGLTLGSGSLLMLVKAPPTWAYGASGELLALTCLLALAITLVRYRSGLVRPFARHFRPFAR